MYLVDTDILSNLLKRSPSTALIAKLESVPPDMQFTSSITLGELVYGAHRPQPHLASLAIKRESKQPRFGVEAGNLQIEPIAVCISPVLDGRGNGSC